MLEISSNLHKLRRSRPPLMKFICAFALINTGCAALFMGVCSAAYTILLKNANIAAIHIL